MTSRVNFANIVWRLLEEWSWIQNRQWCLSGIFLLTYFLFLYPVLKVRLFCISLQLELGELLAAIFDCFHSHCFKRCLKMLTKMWIIRSNISTGKHLAKNNLALNKIRYNSNVHSEELCKDLNRDVCLFLCKVCMCGACVYFGVYRVWVCSIEDVVNSYPACCHRRDSVHPTWQLVRARVSEEWYSPLCLALEAEDKNPESFETPWRTRKRETCHQRKLFKHKAKWKFSNVKQSWMNWYII